MLGNNRPEVRKPQLSGGGRVNVGDFKPCRLNGAGIGVKELRGRSAGQGRSGMGQRGLPAGDEGGCGGGPRETYSGGGSPPTVPQPAKLMKGVHQRRRWEMGNHKRGPRRQGSAGIRLLKNDANLHFVNVAPTFLAGQCDRWVPLWDIRQILNLSKLPKNNFNKSCKKK